MNNPSPPIAQVTKKNGESSHTLENCDKGRLGLAEDDSIPVRSTALNWLDPGDVNTEFFEGRDG